MSSEIIYHQAIERLPTQCTGLHVDLYFWMWQIGSSNCYESDHQRPGGVGRRARSWKMASFGTREQVMRTAIWMAGDCEGGMLKLRSASTGIQPETLIRSVRKLLADADKTDGQKNRFGDGGLHFSLRRPASGEIAEKTYERVEDFFLDHPHWLSQKINYASSNARVSGPRL